MSKTRYAERKALQRAMPLSGKKCSVCGSTKNLQRHHVSKKPKDAEKGRILCQKCHAALHARRGDWGAQPGASATAE